MTARALGIAAGVGAVLAAVLAGSYWHLVLALAVVYALASLSLVVLTGWSGQLNLHVAALGIGWGAYAAYALTTFGVPPLAAMLFAGVLSAPAAAVVGAVAVRFRGLELAIATLAIGLIFERLAFRNLGKALGQRASGGTPFESSFVSMPRPGIAAGDGAFLLLVVAIAVLAGVVVANLSRGATGRAWRAIREREVMAESLGIPVVRYRIGAFVLSIVIAATAGGALAALKLGITPDTFTIDLSFRLLAATVIGGIGSIGGAVIAGGLVAILPEAVATGPLSVFGGERLFLVFGIGMVVVLWRRPGGLAGLARRRGAPDEHDDPLPALRAPGEESAPRAIGPLRRHARRSVLRADGVRVSFGGLVALDDASISVAEGEICALIGPNGAGKSTLFDCVTGLRAPDAGRVYLDGRDVTELSAHRRAAAGIGRTFQTVEVFRDLTVAENLVVAEHRRGRPALLAQALRLPAARAAETRMDARARDIASSFALNAVADRRAGDLPLGLLRVLELGMALATEPRLLLLDEPGAGLDEAETAALAAMIRRARDERGLGVLLVEHDMSLVERLAEHVYVLDLGRVIARGTLNEVRADPVVVERYLGAPVVEGGVVGARG